MVEMRGGENIEKGSEIVMRNLKKHI